jgi:sugar lactone lactonase YvrE
MAMHAAPGHSTVDIGISPFNPTYTTVVTAGIVVIDDTTHPVTGGGTLTLTVDGGSSSTVTLASNGSAIANLGQLSIGSHNLVVTFSGNSNFSGSTASSSISVADNVFSLVGTQTGTALFGELADIEGVAVDGHDNLYATERANNDVRKVDAFDNVTIVPTTGLNTPTGLVFDVTGNLYIADTGNNRVVKVDTNGVQTLVPIPGLSAPTYLSYDIDNNVLYVVDSGNMRVLSYVVSSGVVATAVTGINSVSHVSVLNGTLYVAGPSDGVFMIDTAGNRTPIFSTSQHPSTLLVGGQFGSSLYIGDNQSNMIIDSFQNQTQVNSPDDGMPIYDMATDSQGHVYVAKGGQVDLLAPGSTRAADVGTTFQQQHQAIFRLIFTSPQAQSAITLAEGPGPAFSSYRNPTCSGVNGACVGMAIFNPQIPGLAMGYLNASQSSTVLQLPLWGKAVGGEAAFNGTASQVASGVSTIGGVALDQAGNRYVSDSQNNKVFKISPSGGSTTLPFTGLSTPTFLAVDGAGAVYVYDSDNSQVERLDSNGNQTMVWNTNDEGAYVYDLTALAVDGDTNIVTTGLNYTNKYDAVRSPRRDLFAYAVSTSFRKRYDSNLPMTTGIAIDAYNYIYVTDTSGTLSVLAPDGTTSQRATGLSNPVGVAVDASQTVYIASANSNVITVIHADGSKESLTVNGLVNPGSLAMDAYGDLLLGDMSNQHLVYLDRTQENDQFGNVALNQTSTLAGSITSIGNQPFEIVQPLTVGVPFAQVASPTACVGVTQRHPSVRPAGVQRRGGVRPLDGDGATVLNPAASCDLSYSFTPTSTGPASATNTLLTNSPSFTGSAGGGLISLTGTSAAGTVAAATFNPAALTFTTGANTAAYNQTITLTNPGGATLTIASVAITGTNANDFQLVTNGCGTTLAAGANCSLTIGFTQIVAGTYTATLTATDSASPTTQTVALTGTVTGAPVASLTPPTLSFTTVTGSTSAVASGVLANTGTAPLQVYGVALTGANPGSFVETDNCANTTLATGASCTVNVSFHPSGVGSFNASLTVSDNSGTVVLPAVRASHPLDDGTTVTQSIALTGTATAVPEPVGSLTPPTLSYSATAGASSAAQTVVLSNSGNAPLTIASIALTGANASLFGETTTCGSTLAAGGNCSIAVLFHPTAAGTASASLVVTDNSGGTTTTHTTVLAGTGTSATTVAAADFTVTALPATQSSYRGRNVTYTIQVASLLASNPFTGTVTLAALNLPFGSTASFAPATLVPGTTQPTSAMTVTIPSVLAEAYPYSPALSLGATSAAMLFGFLALRRRKTSVPRLLLLLLIFGGMGLGLSGCGSGNGYAVPTSTTTITVTATSGTTVHSTTVTLTIQ